MLVLNLSPCSFPQTELTGKRTETKHVATQPTCLVQQVKEVDVHLVHKC